MIKNNYEKTLDRLIRAAWDQNLYENYFWAHSICAKKLISVVSMIHCPLNGILFHLNAVEAEDL